MTTAVQEPAILKDIQPIPSGFERPLNPHVPLRQELANTLTMAWRHLIKMIRTPEQLADVAIQPILFPLMFTYILGGAIAGDIKSYLPQFIPGILVMTVITTSMVTGTQIREDMDLGVFDRFKALPMSRVAPLAGPLLADVLRYVMATALTFIVGFAMGYRVTGGLVGFLAAALLVIGVSWAVSWIFAFLGVIARSASAVQAISMMTVFPLTFASNAFVPVDSLPGWLQGFVKVNPVSHLVTAARELTIDGHWTTEVMWTLICAVAIVVIFAPLTVRAYMRKA
jgi:ABC-2 type transport system permease protein